MRQPEFKPRLIHTKRGAVFALCCTGYVATLSVRDVLWHSHRQHHWLLDFDWLVLWHISLPAWIVAGVNLAFYAGLLWGGVLLYRIAQGKERVLVVGWAAVIFLGLIQFLISASAATAIDYVQAMVTAVAFLAAADILLRMPPSGYPRVDNQTFRST
ncbi:MAG: hypothetical protein DMG48_16375 [Acidobacteria bacterium]|nr:MAG: hypothetical protein DMG48_16375 [Acidobacteriota bacterium]